MMGAPFYDLVDFTAMRMQLRCWEPARATGFRQLPEAILLSDWVERVTTAYMSGTLLLNAHTCLCLASGWMAAGARTFSPACHVLTSCVDCLQEQELRVCLVPGQG